MKKSLQCIAIGVMLVLGCPGLSRSALSQAGGGIVMIANTENTSASSMTIAGARKLLLGEETAWPNKLKVIIVLLPAGTAARDTVLKKICGMTETVFTRRRLQVAFTGETAVIVHDAPSAAAVKTFVRSNPGAVGFVLRSEADSSVKIVLEVE